MTPSHRRRFWRRERQQARSEADPVSLRGLATSLRTLGIRDFERRLAFVAFAAFVSGLAQATLLVLLSQVAVNAALRKHYVVIHGVHLSIVQIVLVSFGLLVIYFVGSYSSALLNSSLSSSALEGVRRSLLDAFFAAQWSVQSEERLGHIQQMLTFNATNIASIMTTLAGGIQAVLTAIALMLTAFFVSPITAVLVLALGLVLSLALRPLNSRSKRSSRDLSNAWDAMGTMITEYTRLTREFRLFGVEEKALTQLERENITSAEIFRLNRRLGQLTPVFYQTLALAFVILAIAIITGHQGAGLASTAAVFLLMLRSLTYGSSIQSTLQQLRSFEGFIDAVRFDFDRYTGSRRDEGRQKIPTEYRISVSGASFTYDGRRDVLSDVTFSIGEGASLAIVGRSGSGKTTLSQLILGLREPRSGSVLIGDLPPNRIATSSEGSPLAFVPQEPVLLRGTISSNISFFRNIPEADIRHAARAAHLHDDICSMPDGYETAVGEGGGAISGGQRQRLAIARALVGRPRVLVLDEPTSALDHRSETLLRQTLRELHGAMTIIIISHRLATTQDSDLLLVLEQGRVADFGPPADLAVRPPFRRVAYPDIATVIPQPERT